MLKEPPLTARSSDHAHVHSLDLRLNWGVYSMYTFIYWWRKVKIDELRLNYGVWVGTLDQRERQKKTRVKRKKNKSTRLSATTKNTTKEHTTDRRRCITWGWLIDDDYCTYAHAHAWRRIHGHTSTYTALISKNNNTKRNEERKSKPRTIIIRERRKRRYHTGGGTHSAVSSTTSRWYNILITITLVLV